MGLPVQSHGLCGRPTVCKVPTSTSASRQRNRAIRTKTRCHARSMQIRAHRSPARNGSGPSSTKREDGLCYIEAGALETGSLLSTHFWHKPDSEKTKASHHGRASSRQAFKPFLAESSQTEFCCEKATKARIRKNPAVETTRRPHCRRSIDLLNNCGRCVRPVRTNLPVERLSLNRSQ